MYWCQIHLLFITEGIHVSLAMLAFHSRFQSCNSLFLWSCIITLCYYHCITQLSLNTLRSMEQSEEVNNECDEVSAIREF